MVLAQAEAGMTWHFPWRRFFLTLLLVVGLALSTRGQQTSQTSQSSSGDTPQSPTSTPTDSPDNPVKTPLSTPPQIEVRAAGSSSPLPSYVSFLRWGPVYVRSFEFFQSYDQISNTVKQGGGIFDQGSFNASVFRTDIVFDKEMKRSRLEFEYSPRLTIVNGQVSNDFANQNANLKFVEQISPRWTLGVGGSVIYDSVRHLYGDYFLDVNAITGSSVPSSFLDGSGSWLTSRVTTTLSYAISATSTLSIAPFYGYGHVGGSINGPQPYSLDQYGGQVRWVKQLSPTSTIEASYYPQAVQLRGTTVLYQTGDVGYTRQFGQFTNIALFGGVLSEGFASGHQWEFNGSAQLSEKFGRSMASVAYFRGMPLYFELGSQGVAQRIEGAYTVRLSQKWYWSVRGGYEDSLSGQNVDLSGKYVSTEAGYYVAKQWNCFFSYGYKFQSSNDPAILSGTRDFYSGGIRWTARPVQ